MNLLIVNDEVIAVQGMMQGIDWKGLGIDEVRTAYDAQMAKDILNSGWQADIILCDIEMPGENGIELLKWIQEKGLVMEKLILTCHADFAFAQDAVRLGCRDYILTPAAYETIEEKVRVCIDAVRKRQKDLVKQHYGDLWLDGHSGDPGTKQPDMVQEAVSYIYAHLGDEDLTVSRIADSLHINADYLNRIFKKKKGTNIRQFIMDERMSLAKLRISEGGYSFSAIAEMVGYANYPSFAAAFRNYYGTSPTEFAEKNRQE